MRSHSLCLAGPPDASSAIQNVLPSQEVGLLIGPICVRSWKVMSRAIDVHHDQLGGA